MGISPVCVSSDHQNDQGFIDWDDFILWFYPCELAVSPFHESGERCQSVSISVNQCQSVSISVNQCQSVSILQDSWPQHPQLMAGWCPFAEPPRPPCGLPCGCHISDANGLVETNTICSYRFYNHEVINKEMIRWVKQVLVYIWTSIKCQTIFKNFPAWLCPNHNVIVTRTYTEAHRESTNTAKKFIK